MLHGGEAPGDEAQVFYPLPSLRADGVPAVPITLPISSDVIRRGLQRKVRCVEGEIEEKRMISIFLGMLLEVFDCIFGDGGRRVYPVPGRPGAPACRLR